MANHPVPGSIMVAEWYNTGLKQLLPRVSQINILKFKENI